MNRIKQMSLMQKVLGLLLVIAVAALIVAMSLNMVGSPKSSKDKKDKTKGDKQIEASSDSCSSESGFCGGYI